MPRSASASQSARLSTLAGCLVVLAACDAPPPLSESGWNTVANASSATGDFGDGEFPECAGFIDEQWHTQHGWTSGGELLDISVGPLVLRTDDLQEVRLPMAVWAGELEFKVTVDMPKTLPADGQLLVFVGSQTSLASGDEYGYGAIIHPRPDGEGAIASPWRHGDTLVSPDEALPLPLDEERVLLDFDGSEEAVELEVELQVSDTIIGSRAVPLSGAGPYDVVVLRVQGEDMAIAIERVQVRSCDSSVELCEDDGSECVSSAPGGCEGGLCNPMVGCVCP